MAEYSESSSENEERSSHENSICDSQDKMSESNNEPEDLSMGQKHKHSACFSAVQGSEIKASSRNCQSQGPIVLLGHLSYFVALYKKVFTLTAIAQKYHYDLHSIEDEVTAMKWWDILDNNKLEYMKTELEIMLGDNNVELDLQSDLTDTDDEGNDGKDGNETDGNSSSSSIREVVYDNNVCKKYIKPAKERNKLPPVLGMLSNPPFLECLPKERQSVLQNVPQGIVMQSKFGPPKSSTGTYHNMECSSSMQMSRRTHHEPSSAGALLQRPQVASTPQQPPCFGSPAIFEQRCGVVTTSETIKKLVTSSRWKFNPAPSGAPQHHLGSMVIDVPQQKQQIKLEVHKKTVVEIVSI